MTDWTYESLQKEIKGKFKSLSSYKEFARKNKDVGFPVSPDLYFKARGLKHWSASEFLGEYDGSDTNTINNANASKKVEETEVQESEQNEELDEDIEAEIAEMEDVVQDKVKPAPKVKPAITAEVEEENELATEPVILSQGLLASLQPSIRHSKMIELFAARGLVNLVTKVLTTGTNVYSTKDNSFLTFTYFKDGISKLLFHLEKTEDSFNIVVREDSELTGEELVEFICDIVNYKDTPYKGGKRNYFEMTDEEKKADVVVRMYDYRTFTK